MSQATVLSYAALIQQNTVSSSKTIQSRPNSTTPSISSTTTTKHNNRQSNNNRKQHTTTNTTTINVNDVDQDGFVRVVNNKAKRQQQQQQQQQIQQQQQHTSLKKKSAKKEQLPNPTQRQPIDFINPQTSADANSDDDATIKNDEDEPNIIRSVSVDYSVKSDTQRCVQRASLPSTPLKIVKVNTRTEHISAKLSKSSIDLGTKLFPELSTSKNEPLLETTNNALAWNKRSSLSKELNDKLQITEETHQIEHIEHHRKQSAIHHTNKSNEMKTLSINMNANRSDSIVKSCEPIQITLPILNSTHVTPNTTISNTSATLNDFSITPTATDPVDPSTHTNHTPNTYKFNDLNRTRRGTSSKGRVTTQPNVNRGGFVNTYSTYMPMNPMNPIHHQQQQQSVFSIYPVYAQQQVFYQTPVPQLMIPQIDLLSQIEYYFSSDNLIKDMWFRSQMNQNGVVLLTTILKFKRISQTLNSTSPSAHLDILKQVIKKSEMCELMDEGVRLKTGWEYWLVNVTKKVIV